MSWASRYVGIPQADFGRSEMGCDCWGLARLVYARELGIGLPSYDGAYVSPDEHAEVAALISGAEVDGPWHPVATPEPFDLLLFRRGRFRSHIGINVDTRHMLHMDGTEQARIADIRAPRWSSRFCGAYRHVERGVQCL
ncbi:NlpC/P60 family protein [Ruegeria sediminis]|uniref:NlpC/P60 family protein n=1 Tax=Ruegeria sediminis TaxID=2583820 RepID=A0ABY2X357_9RHOB|nr:NlpC/P60 family protein [Ruegeria sediminis]TMV09814.1 NlpC/P60 family protein [Ruegeria sediminis]